MVWQAETSILDDITALLKQSTVPKTEIQRDIIEKLKVYEDREDFNYYLLEILTHGPTEQTRLLSAIMLKNSINEIEKGKLDSNFVEILKDKSMDLLLDDSRLIRTSVGTVIAALVNNIGLSNWNDLLCLLHNMIISEEYTKLKTAFTVLQQVCEDVTEIRTCRSSLIAVVEEFEMYLEDDEVIRYSAAACLKKIIDYFDPDLPPI